MTYLPECNPEKCPEGAAVITGLVLYVKSYNNEYVQGGGTTVYKMLILDDRGFKVFCTIPRQLMNNRDISLRWCRVKFTVTLRPSAKDPYFGTGSRPRKATLLS